MALPSRYACRSRSRSLLRRLCRLQTPTSSSSPTMPPLTRSYMTGMRRSALKETLLRALRNQISSDDDPPSPPPPSFHSFSVHPLLGERWLRLTRSDHLEDITIDATMFDGSAPATRSGDVSDDSDDRLHVSLAVEVSRKDSHSGSGSGALLLQFLCSAWPDAMDVERVFAAPRGIHAIKPYLGPHFK